MTAVLCIQWHGVRHQVTVHAERMTAWCLECVTSCQPGSILKLIKFNASVHFRKWFVHIIHWTDVFLSVFSLKKTGRKWLIILMHREFSVRDAWLLLVCRPSHKYIFVHIFACSNSPPLHSFRLSVLTSRLLLCFWIFLSIVNVCLLFPGLCPPSACRARWESATRGSAGINLENLISGAVVAALNISILLGSLALLGPDPWRPAAGEGGREGGCRGCRVHVLTNRLVEHPIGVCGRWWRGEKDGNNRLNYNCKSEL